jgi:DNA-binding HxlR family transcriptional regulator
MADRTPAPTTGPLAAAVARVGDRWSLLIANELLAGPRRFGELLEALRGLAPNVLAQRLRHLEAEGVVAAHPYSTRPPRFAYELTAEGHELAGALRLLADWGARHGDPAGDPPRHAVCGTPLEVVAYCPVCARAVTDDEADEAAWV